jgi:hypothetical protein
MKTLQELRKEKNIIGIIDFAYKYRDADFMHHILYGDDGQEILSAIMHAKENNEREIPFEQWKTLSEKIYELFSQTITEDEKPKVFKKKKLKNVEKQLAKPQPKKEKLSDVWVKILAKNNNYYQTD